jgi:hypothetical protein
MTANAIAAYTPTFRVNHAPHSVASATTTITIDVPRGDDATATVTF